MPHLAGNMHGHVLRRRGGDVTDLAVVRGGPLHAHAHNIRSALVLAPSQVRLQSPNLHDTDGMHTFGVQWLASAKGLLPILASACHGYKRQWSGHRIAITLALMCHTDLQSLIYLGLQVAHRHDRLLTSKCAALVVVMPQMAHSCLSRGAESEPASEAEYSGVDVPDAESP